MKKLVLGMGLSVAGITEEEPVETTTRNSRNVSCADENTRCNSFVEPGMHQFSEAQ